MFGIPLLRSAFHSAWRSTGSKAALMSRNATCSGRLNSRWISSSRRKAKIASIVDRPATNPDCCGLLVASSSGWILASSFCRPTKPYPYQFSLKTCFVQKLSKFIKKELAVLLFTNTTSQMTSLTVTWLLVILNHWKNFERFSCTGFRTKFLGMLKSLYRCQGCNADNFRTL